MSEPLHAVVARELRRRITQGELAVGDSLPSEAVLTQEFGSSRGTVRQALAGLRADGLIGGGRGRPPVVRGGPSPQRFETFMSFTRFAHESGHRPGQHTVELARRGAGTAAADALGLAPGETVVDVVRLRYLDGEPAMLERSSFPLEVGRHLFDHDTDSGSIYEHLTACGIDLHHARHTIDAVAAGPTEAELLEVKPGTPLLRETRRVTSVDGEPLEYAEDRYRPDRVTFTIDNTLRSRPAVVRELGASLPAQPRGAR